jgi:hypothetical protein
MTCSKNFSLIVPAAADKPEYKDLFPYIFLPAKEGMMICIKSLMGLNLETFDHIYITILRKHAEQYHIDELLKLQFKSYHLAHAKIVVLDEPTASQAETVYQTIQQEHIVGSIFIKDADSSFSADITTHNGVAVYPLEKMEYIDPRNKSYVAVDDMQYITNIIEKRVVSHFFSAGGYCFQSADDFCTYYRALAAYPHLYLSHIIYAMLLNNKPFRPIAVTDYKDWGTSQLFKYHTNE